MRDRPGSAAERPLFRDLPRKYFVLVFAASGLIALSLMLVQVRGGFAYPPLFSLFAKLFQIQFGLLGGAVSLAETLAAFQSLKRVG